VVGRGEACAQAIALAQEIARFPQTWMRADRLSALRQWDLSEEDAISNEMRGGLEVIGSGETFRRVAVRVRCGQARRVRARDQRLTNVDGACRLVTQSGHRGPKRYCT
jgi:hypothetical protein